MRRHRTLALFVAVVGLVLVGLTATSGRDALAAGSQSRTFVATTGSDANPCTRVAPCRMFSAALLQTASRGEIVALDSGGYGAVVINEAVTIAAAPGVHASISPASGTAIRVEAGSGDVVRLRNLYLNGQGASYGVYFAAGSALQIENLTVDGFYSSGIFMSVSIAADLYIADTVVRNNGFGIFDSGVYVKSGVAYSHASIVRTRLENNTGYGMFVTDYVRASVKDSVASGNGAVHRGTGASAG